MEGLLNLLLNRENKYSKLYVAIIGAAIFWATVVVKSPSHAVTADEWIQLAAGISTALGVGLIGNAKNVVVVTPENSSASA